MQVKKEGVRRQILAAAAEVFAQEPYARASLLRVAERAGLSRGAIYAYYRSKEALFDALTAPAVELMDALFQRVAAGWRDGKAPETSLPALEQSFLELARAVIERSEAFFFLLLRSPSAYYRRFKERVILNYERNFPAFAAYLSAVQGPRSARASRVFVHTLASTFFCYIEELVMHRAESGAYEQYAREMARFVGGGMRALCAAPD